MLVYKQMVKTCLETAVDISTLEIETLFFSDLSKSDALN